MSLYLSSSQKHTLVSVFKLNNGKKLQENIICTNRNVYLLHVVQGAALTIYNQ